MANPRKLTPAQKAKKMRGVQGKPVDLSGWHYRQGMMAARDLLPKTAEYKQARASISDAVMSHLKADVPQKKKGRK